jgi:hypothetical protein
MTVDPVPAAGQTSMIGDALPAPVARSERMRSTI